MVYLKPSSVDETLTLLGDSEATLLAGGTDVYPALTGRDLPEPVVDISGLSALRGISREDGHFRIGALTRWSELRKADLPPAFHALAEAAAQVGGRQVQNAGTIAGNLCNASPAADGVPPLLILDAEVELISTRGRRRLPLADFLTGARQTVRAPDELLTAILIPEPPEGAASAFEKLGARAYLVISIAMVAALVQTDAEGRIAQARIAVGAASPVARRLTELETELTGQRSDAARIEPRHLEPLAPIDDARGTAAYRLEAVASLCRRAIARAGAAHG